VLGNDDRLQHALELAYRYLNRRDRTEAEVRRHLGGKGLQADAAECSIEALREQGYLDDARFARLLVHDKRELEHWGTERITSTLLARGVDRELIDAALEEQTPAGELDRALSLLRRRFPSPPCDRRERDRALGVLLRKGYDSELAVEALAAHTRQAQQPDVR
jgi:regulatory protein